MRGGRKLAPLRFLPSMIQPHRASPCVGRRPPNEREDARGRNRQAMIAPGGRHTRARAHPAGATHEREQARRAPQRAIEPRGLAGRPGRARGRARRVAPSEILRREVWERAHEGSWGAFQLVSSNEPGQHWNRDGGPGQVHVAKSLGCRARDRTRTGAVSTLVTLAVWLLAAAGASAFTAQGAWNMNDRT